MRTVYRHAIYIFRVGFEWLILGLWTATFITMLMPKGKNYRRLFEKPPYAEFWIAAFFAGSLM